MAELYWYHYVILMFGPGSGRTNLEPTQLCLGSKQVDFFALRLFERGSNLSCFINEDVRDPRDRVRGLRAFVEQEAQAEE